MSLLLRTLSGHLRVGRAAIAGAALMVVPMIAPTLAMAEEVIVTIERVKGVGSGDQLSKSDFFANVTIGGQTTTTDVVRNQNDASPNWQVRRTVPRGTHDIKIEIRDKDLTKTELIDITRTAGKRDLEFKVNTRGCRVLGFAEGYRCGQRIVRAGNEGKAAEVTFKVEAR